jgi:hypothetical protein
MKQDEAFKSWWHNEGSQAPYTHHDCEEHTMRMCEIAWANAAYKEREACAKIADSQLFNTNALLTAPMQSSAAYQIGVSIRARGQA